MKSVGVSVLIYFLFFSLYSGISINSFLFPSNKKIDNMKKIMSGFDERYPTNGTFVNQTELAIFNIHWKQLEVLRMLQSSQLSVYSKIHLIDHYDILSSTRSIYAPHLHSGGLFRDWD
jgi:hypothetical protein